MTLRGLLIGLFIAVAIAALCQFNDGVIRRGSLISDLLPPGVYGPLILIILLLNPALRYFRKKWALSARELAVITTLALLSGSVASWGMVRLFPTSVMLPNHHVRTKPGWEQERVVELAPERMVPDISRNTDVVLDGYVTGLAEGDEHISFMEVPWYGWVRPFAFWIPLFVTILAITVGMAVVVHKQWIEHEQLPYPTITFAHAMFPGHDRERSAVFRERMFWIAAGVILVIHLNNYFAKLWPTYVIPVKLYLDFMPLSSLFPAIMRGGGYFLLHPNLLFSVIGLSYLIASDVSFSMGVMPFVFVSVAGWLSTYGIVFCTGNHLAPNYDIFLFTGGYIGLLTVVLYTGRRYYAQVLKSSLGLGAADKIEPHVTLAMRLVLVGTLLFIIQLMAVGLEWQLAVIFVLLALMTWLMVSRVLAETGAFHIGSQIFPGGFLWGMMGAVALGPKMLAIVYLLTATVLGAPGWAPMAFATQGYKLVDLTGEKMGKVLKWSLIVAVLCTLIAIPATLYWQYDQGAMLTSSGWMKALSKYPGDNLVVMKQQLRAQGMLETAESLGSWRRILHLRPSWNLITAMVITLCLSLLFGFCRLRFPKWPLHPVVFIFIAGHQGKYMAWSFLIGWAIKAAVSRYGGGKAYQRVKPLMIGIIAGDLVGRFIPMLVGIIYYAFVGKPLM